MAAWRPYRAPSAPILNSPIVRVSNLFLEWPNSKRRGRARRTRPRRLRWSCSTRKATSSGAPHEQFYVRSFFELRHPPKSSSTDLGRYQIFFCRFACYTIGIVKIWLIIGLMAIAVSYPAEKQQNGGQEHQTKTK